MQLSNVWNEYLASETFKDLCYYVKMQNQSRKAKILEKKDPDGTEG